MNVFRKFKATIMYLEAVRKADRAHEKTGARFYVLPTDDGKLLVMDRKNFRLLKQKRYINSRARTQDLIAECFYFTPYLNGDCYITAEQKAAKRAQFYEWMGAYYARRKGRFFRLK